MDLKQVNANRSQQKKKGEFDMSKYPVDKIRNFSIIAHVDHGKSTLADRFLEITGTISQNQKNAQVLDKLQVEKERGITVKAQTASLFYDYKGETYLLNLIDTPGHVDFNYEVSRSLAACQGVILLVDANQGVQAQTMANFYLAFDAGLTIIPVLNKIDLPNANPEEVKMQMNKLFDINSEDILKVSAKHGTGVEDLLQNIIEKIPPPSSSNPSGPLKALVFDSWYDHYKGAVANIAIRDGCIQKGEKITTSFTKKVYEVTEVGIQHPNETPVDILYSGQVGYIMANMKNVSEAQVGDTIFDPRHPVEPFKGFKPAKPMVYAGIFPSSQSEFPALQTAMKKLTLNDSSVSLSPDMSPALGAGWRVGFLGLLHMDVFNQRLEQEFDASVIVTTPNVPYKVKVFGSKMIKKYKGEEVTILNPCDMPPEENITEYFEPIVKATIILPDDYLTEVVRLCEDYIDEKRILMKVIFPLNEILIDFFDNLKALTSGYASFDYEDHGYQSSDLIKYGGDITRKAKLLRKQAVGKKKMREIGKIQVPKDAFVKVLKRT
ncbi:hypothetical protein KUTeg_024751 [Tegillarca granosa]|uniref:Translation factor GUF1 homolog, mitochondrial n=1 Tax=Tegillarca granosa TaxID=220873 RepID=A0ABQ9DZ92_TEGGR|nr:hypothetical protein KUTeg_024751 [Tegillarca granosa]